MSSDKTGYIITKYHGLKEKVIVPEKYQGKPIMKIGESAFSGCMINSITIPSNVTKIIFYTGTEDMWNNVSICNGNSILNNASTIFNYNL